MGNAFLQLFMRGGPAALKAVQGFGAKAAPKAVKAIADTVTNPQTYRALAGQAERVLQRPLPQSFAGANFGNIPTRFTGMITDLTNMPAGLGQTVQTGMVNRALQEAAGAVPQLSRGVTQAATGALRAPVIGDALRTGQSVLTSLPQTAIQMGGQFARDPGLRREFLKQFGGTSEKAVRALTGQSGFGQVGSLVRNLAPGGATGLRGTAVLGGMGGMAWGLADPKPMIDASHGLLGFLQDRNLVYDPRKDPRVTSIQDRPVVNPGELAPVGGGGTPPPAPTLPAPPLVAGAGPQAGQQTPPPPSLIGTGVMSNGAGVPAQRENVLNRTLSQEVLNAAQQYSAPTNVPLSSFYEGQQQLGRSMMQKGNLVSELQALGAGTGMAPENFQQWVKANPGLAYREMLRLKQM